MATHTSYTECYGSGRSTVVAKSCKIIKEMADIDMKIGVQPKLDEHCIFGLGWQQSEKAMLVTRPMLILLYPDCGDIF